MSSPEEFSLPVLTLLLINMYSELNNNPDWDSIYYCVTVDMPPRGNFILGASETREGAKSKAASNVMLLGIGRMGFSNYHKHAQSIMMLDLYYGMLVDSTENSSQFNRYSMRLCEAKVYIYGEDRGYDGMSYILSDEYENLALFANYYDSYYDGIRHDRYAMSL